MEEPTLYRPGHMTVGGGVSGPFRSTVWQGTETIQCLQGILVPQIQDYDFLPCIAPPSPGGGFRTLHDVGNRDVSLLPAKPRIMKRFIYYCYYYPEYFTVR